MKIHAHKEDTSIKNDNVSVTPTEEENPTPAVTPIEKENISTAKNPNFNIENTLKIYAKPHIFALSAGMFSAFLVIVISIVLTLLWGQLDAFEKSSPENAIKEFINVLYTDTSPHAMQLANVKETEFFSELDYQKYMQENLGTDPKKIIIVPLETNDTFSKFQLFSADFGYVNLKLTKNKEGKFLIQQDEIVLKSLKLTVPEYAKVLANGKLLDEKFKTDEKTPIKSFDTLKNKSKLPKQTSYNITGFLKEPQIEIEGIDKKYMIEKKVDDVIQIEVLPTLVEKNEVEAIAKNASKAYVSFVNDDKSFPYFGKYLERQTEYYDKVKTFDNTWATDHTSIVFGEMQAENTMAYSPNHFVTTIKFDSIVKNKNKSRTYKNEYTISLIKENGIYKVVNFE